MQAAPLRVAQSSCAGEQHPDRLHRRERADPACHRAQNAVLGAGVAIVCIEGIADETPIARVARQVARKGRDLSLETRHRRREQRDARVDAGIRNSQPRGEIVGSVEYEVGSGDDLRRGVGIDPGFDRLDRDLRIECAQPGDGLGRFGGAHITCGVECLALQIAGRHGVVVDQREAADPRTGEILQHRRADPAEPDQRDMRSRQRDLTRTADLGQDDLACETVEAVVGKGHGRPLGACGQPCRYRRDTGCTERGCTLQPRWRQCRRDVEGGAAALAGVSFRAGAGASAHRRPYRHRACADPRSAGPHGSPSNGRDRRTCARFRDSCAA